MSQYVNLPGGAIRGKKGGSRRIKLSSDVEIVHRRFNYARDHGTIVPTQEALERYADEKLFLYKQKVYYREWFTWLFFAFCLLGWVLFLAMAVIG